MTSTATTSSVKLAWDPNSEADLAGYNIYQTTTVYVNIPSFSQDSSPIFVPLYSLEDPDNPVFELHGLESGITHCFAVTAVNASGNESAFSNTVSFTPAAVMTAGMWTDGFQEVPLEFGQVSVDHEWKPVAYKGYYSNPVVVAGPLSSNDSSEAVARIDRVTNTGFEISVQEWDYLDGVHSLETAGYLVVEAGCHMLGDGTRIQAGQIETDTTVFLYIPFSEVFETVPIVLASVTSFNDEDTVRARLAEISENGFKLHLQEQEAYPNQHAKEIVSYVAWEPSQGEVGGIAFLVDTVQGGMTDDVQWVSFGTTFSMIPALFANIQTRNGSDPTVVRWHGKTRDGAFLHLSEEQSLDLETEHLLETVGFIGLASVGDQ